MELAYTPGDNAGYVEDDSDLEFSDCNDDEKSSSEDEKEGFSFGGVPVPKCDSEDDFEAEMEKELQSKMKLIVSPSVAKAVFKAQSPALKSETTDDLAEQPESVVKPKAQYYDDVYFDSDSDNEGAGEGKKVCKLTNDELFYDPGMDDRDERWVNRQRMAYHNVKVSEALEQKKKARGSWAKSDEGSSQEDEASSSKAARKLPPVPKSDAVLNCPACMTTLCLDCQRHDSYVNQYRAMFVLNCLVIREETLSYKPKPPKKNRKRSRSKEQVTAEEEPSSYNPVRCSECNTEVAVYDQDEVFHFFNVLASAPS